MEEPFVSPLFAYGPLYLYLVLLLALASRKFPSVLGGRTAYFLLALGLSGIVLSQIAPAVVPLRTFDLYGKYTFVFLFVLYLLVVFCLTSSSSREIVIYNLQEEDLLKIPEIALPSPIAQNQSLSAEENTPADSDPLAGNRAAPSGTSLFRAGKNLIFPGRGTVLSVEFSGWLVSSAVLRSFGPEIAPEDWRVLRNEIRSSFSACRQNPWSRFRNYALWGILIVFTCFISGYFVLFLKQVL